MTFAVRITCEEYGGNAMIAMTTIYVRSAMATTNMTEATSLNALINLSQMGESIFTERNINVDAVPVESFFWESNNNKDENGHHITKYIILVNIVISLSC